MSKLEGMTREEAILECCRAARLDYLAEEFISDGKTLHEAQVLLLQELIQRAGPQPLVCGLAF